MKSIHTRKSICTCMSSDIVNSIQFNSIIFNAFNNYYGCSYTLLWFSLNNITNLNKFFWNNVFHGKCNDIFIVIVCIHKLTLLELKNTVHLLISIQYVEWPSTLNSEVNYCYYKNLNKNTSRCCYQSYSIKIISTLRSIIFICPFIVQIWRLRERDTFLDRGHFVFV